MNHLIYGKNYSIGDDTLSDPIMYLFKNNKNFNKLY